MCTEKILPLRLVHAFAWFPHLCSPMGNPFVLFVFNAMHMILKCLYEIQENVYLLSPPQKTACDVHSYEAFLLSTYYIFWSYFPIYTSVVLCLFNAPYWWTFELLTSSKCNDVGCLEHGYNVANILYNTWYNVISIMYHSYMLYIDHAQSYTK